MFTRSAGAEAAHKQWVSQGDRASNAAVAVQLIEQTTAVARRVGADFLCVDSARQVGRTFGERLTAALTQGFALGYEQLIVIGNDCPHLSVALLRQAMRLLASTDAVLGPATDGGVYLLGVKRAFFDADVWTALPWQTNKLGQCLASCLRGSGAELRILRTLTDVDDAHDLARLLPQLPAGPLRTRLHRLLRARRPAGVSVPLVYHAAFVGAPLSQRGPPVH
ncbi:TIGR04282 family arsenosugar biosynthesis glycosyltransferase [Hymenobacter terrenus]|uniref:TIGR04282 family arsenosugar biosynthesis glycosyltransferase n=1 Tax=Hymenobacter terrenus TaxID=1629124 RepID=UPI000696F112|nr:DUF2064 domain-containing protein [Hymenobacter terrenus]